MGLSFFPLGVSAKNIHVAGGGNDILSLESLKIGVELMPLLKRQLEVTGCELIKPVFTIVKDAQGKYNFESGKKKIDGRAGRGFQLEASHAVRRGA